MHRPSTPAEVVEELWRLLMKSDGATFTPPPKRVVIEAAIKLLQQQAQEGKAK